MALLTLDGEAFSRMYKAGAQALKQHVTEVNDLNVFPIPDGDTGDNMLLTLLGGNGASESAAISSASRSIGDGMLLSARGNSGVILSQFFDGIAAGFKNVEEAGVSELAAAFDSGVRHAYRAVMEPTEGTILTVIREASAHAASAEVNDPEAYIVEFIGEAKRSLERTPDLLPVLKKAGVVDSGGAGLIYIMEGMLAGLRGEIIAEDLSFGSDTDAATHKGLDLDAFNEDSVLEFGYCTELLLRLQNAKTNPATFDIEIIKEYLKEIGDSVVIFQTGSIVKLHVHTMTPQNVLGFCQQFGEFLTVKIENMSLQHNNLSGDGEVTQESENDSLRMSDAAQRATLAGSARRDFGVVAVAAGRGIQDAFRELGADVIVDGGQSMNPSSEAFIEAFEKLNANTIYVLPNNGNVILAAMQAARMYQGADVRIIQSKTIGEGYTALSMYDPDGGSADEIEETLNMAMEGVVTAEISRCARDSEFGSLSLKEGQYIGFVGKNILAAGDDRLEATNATVDKMDFTDHEVFILIRGAAASEAETEAVSRHIRSEHRNTEVYVIDGQQDIYDYILILG